MPPDELVPSAEGDELEVAVRNAAYKKGRYVRIPRPSGDEVAIGWYPDNSWLDVFAKKRRKGEKVGDRFTGGWGDFGFSLVESRWSYQEAPPGAGEIRQVIDKYFRWVDERVEYREEGWPEEPKAVTRAQPAAGCLVIPFLIFGLMRGRWS